jgi:hypothetical protein
LKEERFILAHLFTGFSLWSLDHGPVVRQTSWWSKNSVTWSKNCSSHGWERVRGERKREIERERNTLSKGNFLSQ